MLGMGKAAVAPLHCIAHPSIHLPVCSVHISRGVARAPDQTTLCNAHRRVRLLEPDPAADADALSTPQLGADAATAGDASTATAPTLDAYPCRADADSNPNVETGAVWTVSADDDIDNAGTSLNAVGNHQLQQHGQQPLPQPLLTLLQAGWQHHCLLLLRTNSSAATSHSVDGASSSIDEGRGNSATVKWKASSKPHAAAASAAATAADEVVPALTSIAAAEDGGFFGSRVSMLLHLKQQQLQVQRQHVLAQKRQQLYRYTITEDGSFIQKQPSQGLISPLKQASFPLAKQQPMQQQTQHGPVSNSSLTAGDALQPPGPPTAHQLVEQQQQQQVYAPLPVNPESGQPLTQPPQQQQQPYPPARPAVGQQAARPSGVTPQDPSRGLCLSVFLYCCSRNEFLSLTWQLGLAPSALRFVSRVADADVVLHVKPGKGQRHFQYEEYRAQAADKGIPFIDLKNLSLLELQLYLLPVFRLYAGELSPRDLLLRKKRRGPKKRYESIKLPPARPS